MCEEDQNQLTGLYVYICVCSGILSMITYAAFIGNLVVCFF